MKLKFIDRVCVTLTVWRWLKDVKKQIAETEGKLEELKERANEMTGLISRGKVLQYIALIQMGFNADDETETTPDQDVFEILEEMYNYIAQLPAETEVKK